MHDLFFRERLEYPTFAWQEALVNAVAHRDYALTGASIEVWMFDDHITVRSPGLPPAPVTLEQLRQQKSIHFSRNPLIVRVLADLGYLREMGEGVPRMYQEMEHYGLNPPELAAEGFIFSVTLRNAPIYDEARSAGSINSARQKSICVSAGFLPSPTVTAKLLDRRVRAHRRSGSRHRLPRHPSHGKKQHRRAGQTKESKLPDIEKL